MGKLKSVLKVLLHVFGGVFALVAAPVITVALHDGLYCRYPSPEEYQRIVFLYQSSQRVLFKAEATMNCWFSPDGSFPNWRQGALVEFRDRNAFLTGSQSRFEHGVDFEAREVKSGTITIDRTKSEATASLQLQSTYEYMEPANSIYSMHDPRVLP